MSKLPPSKVPLATFRAVAGRTFVPNENDGTTNQQVMAQTHHQMMSSVNGLLQIWWPNWYSKSGGGANGGATEILPGAAANGTATVIYQDRTTGVNKQVRLLDLNTGATSLTATSGAFLKGVVAIDALRGSAVLIRFWGNFPNGMNYNQKSADYNNGDAFNFGATVTDQTADQSTITNGYAGGLSLFSPCLIAGVSFDSAAVILSDSRDFGLADVANDSFGHIGTWPRMLGPKVAYINMSVPGDTAADFATPANSILRRSLAFFATHQTLGFGINDTVAAGLSATATLASVKSIAAMVGLPAYVKTLDPWTGGSTNTTARDAQRIAYNTSLRALPSWLVGVYDPDSVMANNSASPSTYGNPAWIGGDGVHETNVGNAYSAANVPVSLVPLGGPSVPTVPSFVMTNLGTTLLSWHRPNTATPASWPDSTGVSGNAFTQATMSLQGTVPSGGGLTQTSSEYMTAASIPADAGASNELCVMVIAIPAIGSGNELLTNNSGNGGRDYQVGGNAYALINNAGKAQIVGSQALFSPSATKQILQFRAGSTASAMSVAQNGGTEQFGSGPTVFTGTGGLTQLGPIGTTSPATFYEIVRVNNAISATELAKVVGKLAWDHGIQAKLPTNHPYYSAPPSGG